jgi:hypothetical protein
MNDTTASDPCNARLSDRHLEELAASGITPQVAAAAGLYTETNPDRLADLLNWSGPAKALGPCLVYPYLDATGDPTGYHRLKPTTPRASKTGDEAGKPVKYEGPKGRPNRLYVPPGTRAALADPTARLIVTEGEKKALAADACGFACVAVAGVWAWQQRRAKGADGRGAGPRQLIPDLVAVAWAGRTVFVVFDSDAADNPKVRHAEAELVKALAAAGADVRVTRLPPAADPTKQGLDDYLMRHGADALRRLLNAPPHPATRDGRRDADAKERKPSAADELTAIALAAAELWHDDTAAGFATVGRRTLSVRSKLFRQWLTHQYRAASGGKVPNAEALAAAVNAIEAAALYDGPLGEARVRVAGYNGNVYLHLADAADTVLEVTPAGWRECPDPPVRFRRSPGSRPLPHPAAGGSLDALRELLNLPDGPAFTLIVAAVGGALLPGGPFPVVVANGEQGSGKTTVTRVLKALLDPAAAPVRSEPKEARDLMIAARNNHLLALDNLSHLPPWLSDALCRLATGGGFATRELYTDDGEVVFDAKRPVLLNGIEEFVTRGDLLERSVLLRLPAIPEDRRVPESVFWRRFADLHPLLLGAVLDRVAGGLRELPSVHLERLPRMADFARWAVACERGAGEPARFLEAYTANQSAAHQQALEDSPLVAPLLALVREGGGWAGSPSELLEELGKRVPERKPDGWPKRANGLTGKLRRLAPDLRRVHRLDMDLDGRASDATRSRLLRLSFAENVRDSSSGPSAPSAGDESPTEPPAPADGPTRPGDRPGSRPDRPAPRPAPHRERPADGGGRSRPPEPSGETPWKTSRSDGVDGVDDPAPPVEVIDRAAYQRFLDLH